MKKHLQKRGKNKTENEKVANRKLGKAGNLENLRKVIPSFRFYPTVKIENSDLKISQKNFRDFQDFRGYRVFDLAHNYPWAPNNMQLSMRP